MKKLLGWPLVYICYYLGHWFYLLGAIVPDPKNDSVDDIYFKIYNLISFKPYQFFMIKSFYINNWASLDFWKEDEDDTTKDEPRLDI